MIFSLRQVHGNLKVEVHSHSDSGSEDAIAFSYIPKYLFYIVQEPQQISVEIRWEFLHVVVAVPVAQKNLSPQQELIKNSARATVEASEVDGRRSLAERPIVVTVLLAWLVEISW